MAQMEFQGAKDPTEVRVKNTYFIAPGNDAAVSISETTQRFSAGSQHSDMPLRRNRFFPYVRDLRMPTLILTGSADIADNQAVSGL